MPMDLFNLKATLGIDTSEFVEGITGLDDLFGDFGGTLGTIGKGFGSVLKKAIPYLVDFGKSVIDTGLNFGEAMGGVYAVMNATDELDQNMLKTAAITEAMASSFTTAEAASALYYEGLAGYTTEEAVAGLRGLMLAAEAAGEPLAGVADILTDAVRMFHDDASDQEHYADVLAAAATNTNTTILKMGQSLKYVGPVAGALGYSIEDVAIALGVLADNGIKSSQAGTTLRNIIQRIATNAGATSKDMGALDIVTKKLGVQFYDSEGKARPFIEFIEDCRESWKGMGEEARNELLNTLGDTANAGKTNTEILKELSAEIKNTEDLLDAYGNAKTEAAQQEYAEEIRETARAYKSLFDTLGMNINPDTDSIDHLAGALDQARIKLGLMSDEEKIYYSKQISSLRGMAGWLSIMEATEDSFNGVTESIYNAEGAAEQMRDLRLGSNLAGDLLLLESRIDALRTLVFGEIEGPARELVQWAIGAIDNINTAIQLNGLEGGIQALADEIKSAGDKLAPVMESIGQMIAPVITSIIDNLLSPESIGGIMESATKLGAALGKGVIEGAIGSVLGSDSTFLSQFIGPSLKTIAGFFGISPSGGTGSWLHKSLSGRIHSSTTGSFGTNPGEVYSGLGRNKIKLNVGIVDIEPKAVQDGIDKATSQKSAVITPDIDVEETQANNSLLQIAQNLMDKYSVAVSEGVESGWIAVGKNADKHVIEPSVEISDSEILNALNTALANRQSKVTINGVEIDVEKALNKNDITGYVRGEIAKGAESGSASLVSSLTNGINKVGPTLRSNVTNELSRGGQSGSQKATTILKQLMVGALPTIANNMITSLGTAGNTGGKRAANNLKSNINASSPAIRNALARELGNAGSSAGSTIVNAIQRAINFAHFTVNVVSKVSGWLSGIAEKHAKSMYGGTILRGATMFGVNASGQPLIGGEAGTEAVVGTTSLQRMISDAVSNSMINYAGPTTIQIYQQPGESAEALADRIDRILARKEMRRRASLR